MNQSLAERLQDTKAFAIIMGHIVRAVLHLQVMRVQGISERTLGSQPKMGNEITQDATLY